MEETTINGKIALINDNGRVLVSEERFSRVFPSVEAAEGYYKYGPKAEWVGEYQIVSNDEPMEKMLEIRNEVEKKLQESIKGKRVNIVECGIKDMFDGTASVFAKAEVHLRD